MFYRFNLYQIGEESPGKAERRSVESTDICESIECVTENNRSLLLIN